MRVLARSEKALFVVGTVVLLAALLGCAHGLVVSSEQFLKAAPAVYDSGMTFAEQNKGTLPLATLKVFEEIRVQFPPAYRAFDAGLELYVKSGQADHAALDAKRAALEQIVNSIVDLVLANGGPDLGKKYGVPKAVTR